MDAYEKLRINRIHPIVAELLPVLREHHCYIGGGYARWACSPKHDTPMPKDIDIICPSEGQLRSLEKAFDAVRHMRKGEESSFSITYRAYPANAYPGDIQLLKTIRGQTIEECLDKIDFSVCRVAFDSTEVAVAHTSFLRDEFQRRLSVLSLCDTHLPENALFRLLRYVQKGYDVDQADVMKIIDWIRAAKTITTDYVQPSSSFSVFGS